MYSILDDLNAILDNPLMGGGDIGGHGLVLAMHMLKEQKSFRKFVLLLTENYGHLCDGVSCLQPFNKALTQVGGVCVCVCACVCVCMCVHVNVVYH